MIDKSEVDMKVDTNPNLIRTYLIRTFAKSFGQCFRNKPSFATFTIFSTVCA